MFKQNPPPPHHESSEADTTGKPLPSEAEIATLIAGDDRGMRPAARFMQTGGQPRPAASTPVYKLRQKLDDLDLQMRHPHLNRKWRKKVASVRAEQTPVVRGRKPKPTAKGE